MACPVCGANCRCKRRGPGGLCCGCHQHKATKGLSRVELDAWRAAHRLKPVTAQQWRKWARLPKPVQLPLPLELEC